MIGSEDFFEVCHKSVSVNHIGDCLPSDGDQENQQSDNINRNQQPKEKSECSDKDDSHRPEIFVCSDGLRIFVNPVCQRKPTEKCGQHEQEFEEVDISSVAYGCSKHICHE